MHVKCMYNFLIISKYYIVSRVMQGSESLLFAWNLGKNTTVIDLSQLDKVPAEVNLSICTQSACSLLPPIK